MLTTLTLNGTAMITSIVLAHLLGKAAFGEYGLLRSTFVTFGVLAGSGLGLVVTTYVAKFRATDRQRAGRFVGLLLTSAWGLSVVSAVACLILAGPIAEHVMHAPHLTLPLRIASVLLVLHTVAGVQLGVLNGLEAFGAAARLTTLDALLTLAFVIAGGFYAGVTGAIAGTVAAAAVAWPVKRCQMAHACRAAGIPIVFAGISTELPVFWSFVIPSILLGIATQPFEWVGRIIVSRQPDGMGELGVFTAAYAWSQLAWIIPGFLAAPSLPILAHTLETGDSSTVRRLLRGIAAAMLFAALMSVLFLAAASKWLMRAYGEAFASGWLVLSILALAYAVASFAGLFRIILVSAGRMWIQSLHAAIWGVTLISGALLFNAHGALGLAAAYACAFTVLVGTQGWSALAVVRRRALGAVIEAKDR